MATQIQTRTFRILIFLPYNYTTTPTRQNCSKLSFLTDDPSPFHNF